MLVSTASLLICHIRVARLIVNSCQKRN